MKKNLKTLKNVQRAVWLLDIVLTLLKMPEANQDLAYIHME